MNGNAIVALTALSLASLTAAPAGGEFTPTNATASATSAHALEGPSSVSAQLARDDQTRAPAVRFQPLERAERWLIDGRRTLHDQVGLTLAGDYNALVQGATDSLGENLAAGAAFRLYGDWSWPGEPWKNPGSLTFKVENRHRYTEIAPQQLGAQLGYSALTATTWSDAGWMLSNFYWYQQLLDNRLAFVAGIVDTTDYVDTYGLVNPWTDFMNSTLANSATIAFPNQGLGVALRGSITTNLYVLAGLADGNGDPTNPLEGFDTFFTEAEYFTHLELGWAGSWERRMQDNIHGTLWHTAARPEAGLPSGWGGTLSASHLFGDRWLPFLRMGWSDGGGGAALEAAVSVGAGYYLRGQSDLLALGFTWGRPSAKTYGDELRDEYTIELLYRLQLTHRLCLSPDVQLLICPARNPDANLAAVFGLRARLVF